MTLRRFAGGFLTHQGSAKNGITVSVGPAPKLIALS